MVEEKIINYQQCNRVVKILDGYFKNKKQLASIDYPSIIEYKSNKYFIYMFYSCLLDYGMRSKIYHRNLIETYKKYPNIFHPNYVVKMEEEPLKDIIVNNIHPRYPNVAVKKWMNLSKRIAEYDDILNYLKTLNSFKELESFIKSIQGYGQKTGGLLIRIICDTKVCNFKGNVESIPIDRHDIEISYLTGIVSSKNIGNKDIQELSNIYIKIGKELNINPSDIDKYLWEIGNSFCNQKKCNECPLKNFCKKRLMKDESKV